MLVCLIWFPFTQAWVAPVDFTADNEGIDVDKNTVTATSGDDYDRCDTATNIYTDTGGEAPDFCHRWNLVWEPITDDQNDWTPEAGEAGYRLPTIKELVRLFDYTGGTGFAVNPIINSWLTTTVDKKEWLISSSYRDIDGLYDANNNNRLQIFAINIATGEIRTFEPGDKSGANRLDLCEELNELGECTFPVPSTQTVYAIKVKTDRLLSD